MTVPITVLVVSWDWSVLLAMAHIDVPADAVTDAGRMDALAQRVVAECSTRTGRADLRCAVATGTIDPAESGEAVRQMRADHDARTAAGNPPPDHWFAPPRPRGHAAHEPGRN